MQLKKPVVIILFTTSPKNGPWMPKADAVIAANYPQNGGAAAIADTLLGKISPGGRLPVTWHKHWNCSIEPCAPVVRMRLLLCLYRIRLESRRAVTRPLL